MMLPPGVSSVRMDCLAHPTSLYHRPLVDQEKKQQLIMKKQIHQATSKMLRRPSHFTRGQDEMSRTVLEALLTQRSEGRLTGSALESWVDRFELYHTEAATANMDVDAQFEALHREFESEYATSKFDSSIPLHTPLDSTAAKHKVTLAKKKSFSSSNRPSLPSMSPLSKDPPSMSPLSMDPPSMSPVSISPLSKAPPSMSPAPKDLPTTGAPFSYLTSPRQRQSQASNIARNLKQQEEQSQTIVLGKEPDVEQSAPIPAPTHTRFPFLRHITDSLDRRARTPVSAPPDSQYEEIAISKGRKTETKLCKEERSECGVQTRIETQTPQQTKTQTQDKRDPGPSKPFERLHDCLFHAFTACVPWWLMRKVYWKREQQSEQKFVASARRSSQTRRKGPGTVS